MDTLYAYLAGVIDSDGYISIKRSTYHARTQGKDWNPAYQEVVGIKQVAPEAIDMLHATFGGYRGMQAPNTKNGHPLHSWQVTNRQAAALLAALRPHLRIKTRQADLALALRANKESPAARLRGSPLKRKQAAECVAERERLYLAIKALNDTRIHQPKLV